ncbi:MAG: oxidative damage protection protein [Coxiellaceae bacterium]|nr:oxidative damage protection protein [Coxiellaceae bacterium]
MSNQVQCQRLGKQAEALDYAPYPGPLGQRVLENISKEGWQDWINHQTMLINEYRLNLTDKKSREFLETEMVKFLFEGGDAKPEGFTPPED